MKYSNRRTDCASRSGRTATEWALFSLLEIGIRFGHLTNGFRNPPTGSKGRYIQVLATRLVIAGTRSKLIVGHGPPFRISALACRIESRDHTGKGGNSRQISGTSEASKTQSMLIGTRRWAAGKFRLKMISSYRAQAGGCMLAAILGPKRRFQFLSLVR